MAVRKASQSHRRITPGLREILRGEMALQREVSTAQVDSRNPALRVATKAGGLTVTGGEQPTVVPFHLALSNLAPWRGSKSVSSRRAFVLLLSVAVSLYPGR